MNVKFVNQSGYTVAVDLYAAGKRLWEMHAQERGWDELATVEQDQMISEAEEIVMVALGVQE